MRDNIGTVFDAVTHRIDFEVGSAHKVMENPGYLDDLVYPLKFPEVEVVCDPKQESAVVAEFAASTALVAFVDPKVVVAVEVEVAFLFQLLEWEVGEGHLNQSASV